MSATNVIGGLDPQRFEVLPIYITREGRWILSKFENGSLSRPHDGTELCLVPGGRGQLMRVSGSEAVPAAIDLLFPVLHGLGGEDGSVQGLAEVAGVAFVGCDILGSAVALDKDVAKRLLREAGVPVARAVTVTQNALPDFATVEATLGLPVFVKPARQGSSVGVRKVSASQEWKAALEEGFRHDEKLVVEEFVKGREIEFSVLEDADGTLYVSRPGEIVPHESHGFYSYDAKYIDEDGAALKVPAELDPDLESQMRAMAAKAFRAAGCDAMARVDLFLTEKGQFFINEINTIPGFTNISMYPKAMEASGVDLKTLIDRLIAFSMKRHRG